MAAPKCTACDGSGHREGYNGPCGVCLHYGRLPYRAAVSRVLHYVFKTHKNPSEEDVIRAVKWIAAPKLFYLAGYRDNSGGMGVFGGPTNNVKELLAITPPEEYLARTAYIVKVQVMGYETEPRETPVARWKDGRWQQRKQKPKGA